MSIVREVRYSERPPKFMREGDIWIPKAIKSPSPPENPVVGMLWRESPTLVRIYTEDKVWKEIDPDLTL